MYDFPVWVQPVSIVFFFLLWVGVLIYRAGKQRTRERKQAESIETWLADRDPQALIDASPYSYAKREEKFGYHIVDERQEPPYIGVAGSAEKAEKQILSRILLEENGSHISMRN